MTSIALVTPWPPQHTGIADYAYDLAKALVRAQASVVVYTTENRPAALDRVKIVRILGEDIPNDLHQYDYIVYQLGNNTTYHLWMIPLLQRFPGVIHLHDMVMHHIAAWQTWMQGDEAGYLSLLENWYGEEGIAAGKRSIKEIDYLWESELVTQFPLCEEYVRHAKAVVVHSNFAQNHLRDSLPAIQSFVLPQLYDMQPIPAPVRKLQRIALLGGVDPQKRVDWVIQALSSIYSRQNSPASPLRVDIAGNIDPKCKDLETLAAEASGPGLEIIIHGRVSASEFKQIFENCDLCIALRFPTMGETSAIVMRALQYGIPTIVSDIGWYAELPAKIVKKLPVERCIEALADFIEAQVGNPEEFHAWSKSCWQAAHEEFVSTDYGSRYLEICKSYPGTELILDELAGVLYDCGLRGIESESALLGEILEALEI